jgi:hypothetical protein
MANDVYDRQLALPSAGTYYYAARVRLESEPDGWFYCDVDGHDGSDGFETDQLGTIEVTTPPQPKLSYCETLTDSVTVETGETTSTLEGIVYGNQITPGAGQGADIEGELVWGLASEDPANWTNTVMATYDSDVDGLSPGGLDNDKYTTSVAIPDALMTGDYGYVFRFRYQGGDWLYCDTDGSDDTMGGFEAAKFGEMTVTEDALTYCQTTTASVTVDKGDTTMAILGEVFGANITEGMGQGAGVDAEIVWGPISQDPATWTDSVTAGYDSDVDGLGTLDNDQYSATIMVPDTTTPGDYGYVYRFRLDGGDWLYCDTDGSDDTMGGFEPAKAGAMTVEDPVAPNFPDECNLQFPIAQADAEANVDTQTVYGRIKEIGITDVGDGDAQIVADLLVGPPGVDPSTATGLQQFTTISATYNDQAGVHGTDVDEFEADFSPTTAGVYALYFRFSVDGTNYSYCDVDGTTDGANFDPQRGGAIHVREQGSELVDFCVFNHTNLMVSLGAGPQDVYAEVYENTITDTNGGSRMASDLEVEVLFGAPGVNPLYPGLYTTYALTNQQENSNEANNFDYFGPLYDPATPPAQGVYEALARVRNVSDPANPGPWTYCDNDRMNGGFAIEQLTPMTVMP